MINSSYYGKVVSFILMFADCLNQYGWQKRAEHECKEFYGKYDYEKKLKERCDKFESLKTITTFS